jgi:hypothetical protein
MNPFIHQSNDKFSTANTVCTSNAGETGRLISLRYHSSENDDAILLDLLYEGFGNQPHIDQGNLFLLINGTKRYSFVPHINQPASSREFETFLYHDTIITWEEYVYYEISKDILREMAYASSVEFKVTGASVNEEIEEDGDRPSFIIIAKALYNAIFDNSAFVEDLKNEKRRLEEEKQREEEEEQRKEKEEQKRSVRLAQYRRRASVWENLNELIWSGGIFGTIVVGGIWSFEASSWEPMIWFGVVTVVLGSFSLYMRSYCDSKIKECESTHK